MLEQAKAEKEAALSNSISAYVSSLPEPQLAVLTSGISEDVVGAMRQVGMPFQEGIAETITHAHARASS